MRFKAPWLELHDKQSKFLVMDTEVAIGKFCTIKWSMIYFFYVSLNIHIKLLKTMGSTDIVSAAWVSNFTLR